MGWSGGFAEWIEGDTAFISIAFSWHLPQAYQRAIWYKAAGYNVRAGGPGTFAMPKYLADVAQIGGSVDALTHHNPAATIASRGCPIGCWFCIVPKMEGKTFTLLPDFTPRPILCDNNLSALPTDYQDYIIEKYLKFNVPLMDANSGFEPQSFTEEVYQRWKKINRGVWRLAFDEEKEADAVHRSMQILKDEPSYKKRMYVLIGNEPWKVCLSRIMRIIEWGGEPYVQAFVPLNALERKPIVRFDWTEQKLTDMARWANRWIWRKTPFSDYNPSFVEVSQ
jgi:hypothetical protein